MRGLYVQVLRSQPGASPEWVGPFAENQLVASWLRHQGFEQVEERSWYRQHDHLMGEIVKREPRPSHTVVLPELWALSRR